MLILSPNCEIIKRDNSYIVKNALTNKFYMINEHQYLFLKKHFLYHQNTISSEQQLEISNHSIFVKKMVKIGVLIDAMETNQKKIKRFIFSDIFHMRLQIINPDGFCEKLLRYCKFLFTWYALLIYIILIIIVLMDIINIMKVNKSISNEIGLGGFILSIYIVSILFSCGHELSHALVCKLFGGHVSEIGVAFLYLSPCFYCNVSDSYMFDRKYKRVLVPLVGIIYDFVIASITTIFLYNIFAVDVALIKIYLYFSAIIVLNEINPLIKHDGYYVLTELTSCYNLRRNSFKYIFGKCKSRNIQERRIYILYAICSGIFTVFFVGMNIYSIISTIKMF